MSSLVSFRLLVKEPRASPLISLIPLLTLVDITSSSNRRSRSRSRSYSPPPSNKRSRRSASPNNNNNNRSSRQRSYSSSRSRSRSPPRRQGPHLHPEVEKFIRTVAGKVKDLGPEFENHLREKEKENPKFGFLKDEMVSPGSTSCSGFGVIGRKERWETGAREERCERGRRERS